MAWPEIVTLEQAPAGPGRGHTAITLPSGTAGAVELDGSEGRSASLGLGTRSPAAFGAPEPFVSACDPLGAEVPVSLKEKIWSSEYIELSVLLKQNFGTRDELGLGLGASLGVVDTRATVSLCQSEFGLGLQLQPQTKNRKIVSVEQWTSVFLCYTSIYMEKHVERGRELMKYMDLIRHAARAFAGYGWRDYDTQFRVKQARLPGRSWASVDAELWLMLVASNGPAAPSTGPHALRQQYRGTLVQKNFSWRRKGPGGPGAASRASASPLTEASAHEVGPVFMNTDVPAVKRRDTVRSCVTRASLARSRNQ
nr:uncharacterized protein LOC129271721 [Lytechinus pictus]